MRRFGAVISGTGSYVPQRRLTNAELEKLVDTNDEWIVQRTGISERRIAAPEESTSTMALEAAQRALQAAQLTPDDIDLIIVATLTPDMLTPSTACILQDKLGIKGHIGAFDLGAACSGFVYAIATGSEFIRSGAFKHVLVVGAETLSRIVDYTDRGTCILFGDGAGALVLSAHDDPKMGLQAYSLGADGSGGSHIHVPAGGSHIPASLESIASRQHYLKMNGREVYKFAVHQMTNSLEKAMRDCNLTAEEVKLVIPHQSNVRIIDSATEKMGFPRERVMVNIDRYGNTSAASVAIALDEAVRSGRCGAGDWIILLAFGAGLTWASATVRL